MIGHLWVFPWFSLLAGLLALFAGAFSEPGLRSRSATALPRPLITAWLVVTGALLLAMLRVGHAAGVDWIPARGILLGSLAGALMVEVCRRCSPGANGSPGVDGVAAHRWRSSGPLYLAPMLFGLATAAVSAGRLWLTHGEISGLTAVAMGAAVAVLCLGAAPALLNSGDGDADLVCRRSTLGLLFLACLVGTVELGFTRAGALKEMFWADMPLLMGAALCLGILCSAAMARASGAVTLVTSLPSLCAAVVAVSLLSRQLAHSLLPAEVTAMGFGVFGLVAALSLRSRPSLGDSAGDNPAAASEDLSGSIAFLMIAAACVGAFALWSGYGLGMMALGGWSMVGWGMLHPTAPAVPVDSATRVAAGPPAADGGRSQDWTMYGMAFITILLLHRLLLLQSGSGIRTGGPGDTWDLFAIALGALLPLAITAWARVDSLAARLPGWAMTLQWSASAVLAGVALDYTWQRRSLAGVLLGLAVGQLLAGLGGRGGRLPGAVTTTALLVGLALFQFLPLFHLSEGPTRHVRMSVILLCAVLALVRLALAAWWPQRGSIKQQGNTDQRMNGQRMRVEAGGIQP